MRISVCLDRLGQASQPAEDHGIVSDPGNFYGADPYTFLFASLMILIFGPGYFAMDTLIAKRFKETASR
jgi:hypothetical protein